MAQERLGGLRSRRDSGPGQKALHNKSSSSRALNPATNDANHGSQALTEEETGLKNSASQSTVQGEAAVPNDSEQGKKKNWKKV